MYKLMKESDNMMNDAMTTLMKTIKEDYYRWTSRNYTKELSEINVNMINEFNENLTFEEGRKYIKIIERGSAWGFIVKGEDEQFKVGDILKPASWATPARNAARGNVFEDYTIQWTGPLYLK